MSDSYTEVTSQNWFSRIGESIKGILFGIIAIPLTIVLLWWNEGRAVTTANSLKEGAAAVVNVAADKVDPANDKKLVHLSGDVTTAGGAVDDEFGIKVPALRIDRSVEIYQWEQDEKTEKREKVGGSEETITTYTYQKKWVDKPIDSSGFKKPAGHENKGEMVANDKTFAVEDAKLGAFKVPSSMVQSLSGAEAYPVKEEDLPDDIKKVAIVSGGKLYYGADPAKPQIGDQRVAFEIVKPGSFSIMAAQLGDTFGAYQTKAGDALTMIEPGVVSAEVMFKNAESANTIITWLVRFFGFLFMAFGFMAIMRPLSVLGSVVPFIGNIIGMGTGLISFVLAGSISFVVIAIAWIFVRPVLGIALLALAVGGFIYMRKLAAASKPAAAAAA
ncbi:TMEM43 family protein [Prosthecobacter sp.]|uniref:TMEM43 family protein n=1 Tax=Prosthecobacter sp. TaxID=1965333 RepID=UPI001DE0FF70|nr:TMEM43 family protein [Prosthecobacter sp.]MCB1276015.1 TMEM43 family protein [Prosthecobacter sp.]